MAELPPPPEGIVLAHFIVSDDVERSRRFYTEVLGGRVVFSGDVTYVACPGRAVPDAAETAPVRDPLLHARSRWSPDRSRADHGPGRGLGARSLATDYARGRFC